MNSQRLPSFLRDSNAIVILGAQFGDEAKGKLVDELLTMLLNNNKHQHIYCIRSNGGANAGHSVWKNGILYDTHNLPSGVVTKVVKDFGIVSNKNVYNVIGSGVLVHLTSMFDEIEKLNAKGLNVTDNLLISEKSHCTFLIQSLYDAIQNMTLGTTKKGIAPTASDKAARIGIRMDDIVDNTWEEKLGYLYDKYSHDIYHSLLRLLCPKEKPDGSLFTKNDLDVYRKELCGVIPINDYPHITSPLPINYNKLCKYSLPGDCQSLGEINQTSDIEEQEMLTINNLPILFKPIKNNENIPTFESITDMFNYEISFVKKIRESLVPLICNITNKLKDASTNRQTKFLFEGANSIMLDPNEGTWPCVTSTNCSISSVIEGTGLNIKWFNNMRFKVIGVTKGYITRVGTGTLPTRASSIFEQKMRQAGSEYGVTTQRARGCGWGDLFLLKNVGDVLGVDCWNLTKLDVMNMFEDFNICVNYRDTNGNIVLDYPSNENRLSKITPVYQTCVGWKDFNFDTCQTFEDLHENVKIFIRFIEEYTGIPVAIINTGKEEGKFIIAPNFL